MTRLGVIAEDMSDVAVMQQIARKFLPIGSFGTKHFVGSGCGKLRRKCKSWAEALLLKGCTHIVVLHDLDDEVEATLRRTLDSSLSGISGAATIVVIPVREIEAWLLADASAIEKAFNLRRTPRVPGSPETLLDAKATLADVVYKASKKWYINSVHNERIAAASRVTALERCRSFMPLSVFLRKIGAVHRRPTPRWRR